ncbi:MAG TPA: hypothetical protein VMF55_02175 [Solirubrobacterales bacterium]|nr:hypothetical protein [Solirubrobacterales bacterium]
MRILITQARFLLGGTETYAVTVAEQLEWLGHPVKIHAGTASDAGRDLVASRGIELSVGPASKLAGIDDVDAVIAQDAACAYALASRRPDLPQIFVTHGFAPIERPAAALEPAPSVVVLNDRVGDHMDAIAGRPPLVRLRQPIDIDRFRPGNASRPKARRVLVLSNYLPADRLRMLEEVCAELGLEVSRLGDGAVKTIDPRPELDRADIVVGYGRSALEGMSMGRATYVWDRAGGDGWVTPETYAAIEADGFSGGATDLVIDRERLRADLAGYRPELGTLGFDLVRKHHSARRHAEALVELLRQATEPRPSEHYETIALLVRAEARAVSRAEGAEYGSRLLLAEHDLQRDRAELAEVAREEEVARREEETARREAVEAKLAEVFGSRSWRAMEPLRRLGARVRVR